MNTFDDIAKQASTACIPTWSQDIYSKEIYSSPGLDPYNQLGSKIDQQISEGKITPKECLGAYSFMLIAGLTAYFELDRKQKALLHIEGIKKIIKASDFSQGEKNMLQRILEELTYPEKEKHKITLNDIEAFQKEYFRDFCYSYINYRDNRS